VLLKRLSVKEPVIIRAWKGVFQGKRGAITPQMPVTGLLVPYSYISGHWLEQNSSGQTELACPVLLCSSTAVLKGTQLPQPQ